MLEARHDDDDEVTLDYINVYELLLLVKKNSLARLKIRTLHLLQYFSSQKVGSWL